MKVRTVIAGWFALGIAALFVSRSWNGLLGGAIEERQGAVVDAGPVGSTRKVVGEGLVTDRHGVSGRVLSAADGVPVYNAQILVFDMEPVTSLTPIATAEADVAGFFIVEGLGADEWYWVRIEGEEYETTQVRLLTGSPQDVVLELGASLRGRLVRWDGQPVAGATVEAFPRGLRWRGRPPQAPGRTDGDGAFELSGLPALVKIVELEFRSRGHVLGSFTLTLNRDPQHVFELTLRERVIMRLTFVDYWTEKDLADLDVRVGVDGAPVWETWTDLGGGVELEVPAGNRDVEILATADGFCETRIDLPRVEERQHLVPLARECQIDGRVIDKLGHPLVGVHVSWRCGPESYRSGGLRLTAATESFSVTNASGHFVLDHIAPSDRSSIVRAELDGFSSAQLTIDVVPSSMTLESDLILTR